jgi:two-component system alkaline phosphatase synthesis response regulator PhoP
MANEKVYVIEDEPDISELISYNLAQQGYKVQTFASGELGIGAIESQIPDLLLLDIMLPGMNGLEICQHLKKNLKTQKLPIIMVTAKGEESDIVKGLELGAEDYITKPFSTAVLKARVEAVLRRGRPQQVPHVDTIRVEGIELHVGRVEVLLEGKKLDLTPSEFKILHFLIQRPGWVFTRSQIVEAIRGENFAVTDRTIDFQMVGLRKKMGDRGDKIETVRGVGYRFKGTHES